MPEPVSDEVRRVIAWRIQVDQCPYCGDPNHGPWETGKKAPLSISWCCGKPLPRTKAEAAYVFTYGVPFPAPAPEDTETEGEAQ